VSDTEKKEVYVFDILDDGSLVNRRIFVPEYSDGMTIDELNNVYLTNGGVEIYTSEGQLISTINLPYKASNVCFGGKDKHTLYITARQCLFAIRMKVTGQ
jgi:gluconolactonase